MLRTHLHLLALTALAHVGLTPALVVEAAEPTAAQRLQAVEDAIVLVAITCDGQTFAAPGVIFAREGDRAFIAPNYINGLANSLNRSDKVESIDIALHVGAGPRKRIVKAECVTQLAQGSMVLAAAAAELPPPIPLVSKAKLADKMAVRLLGVEADGHPASFARFNENGQIAAAIKVPQLPAPRDPFAVRCMTAPAIALAFVATEQGEVLGMVNRNPRTLPDGAAEYAISPLASLPELFEPKFHDLHFGFVSGDAKQVVCEVVVVFHDPLNRLQSPRLLWRQEGLPDERPRERPRDPDDPVPPNGRMLPDAQTVELEAKPISEVVLKQRPQLARYATGKTWIARITTPNPSAVERYAVAVQASFENSRGEAVYARTATLTHNFLDFRGQGTAVLPDIPGLDGKNRPGP